jgi:putative endonuclease
MKFEDKIFYVYILASKPYGTLYTGVTSDLIQRVAQHKNKKLEGFTSTYKVDKLVYYEIHYDGYEAFHREKRIKKWKRQWKINLIVKDNPYWEDRYFELLD